MRPLTRRAAEVVLLLAAAATPLLPGWTAPAVLAVLAAVWLAFRPPRREVLLAGGALVVAVAALAVRAGTAPAADPADPRWRAATLAAYEELWRELAAEAERARRVLPDAARAGEEPVEVFRTLARIVPEEETGRGALLLVDPDDTPVAWAGEGLLHELAPQTIPRAGADFRASFAAVTALFAVPLDGDAAPRRSWRVIAARSFATDHLPFAPGAGPGPPLRWSLVADPAEAAPGATVLAVERAPDLVIAARGAGGERTGEAPISSISGDRAGQAAGFALAFALFALAVARGVGMALGGERAGRREGRFEGAGGRGATVGHGGGWLGSAAAEAPGARGIGEEAAASGAEAGGRRAAESAASPLGAGWPAGGEVGNERPHPDETAGIVRWPELAGGKAIAGEGPGLSETGAEVGGEGRRAHEPDGDARRPGGGGWGEAAGGEERRPSRRPAAWAEGRGRLASVVVLVMAAAVVAAAAAGAAPAVVTCLPLAGLVLLLGVAAARRLPDGSASARSANGGGFAAGDAAPTVDRHGAETAGAHGPIAPIGPATAPPEAPLSSVPLPAPGWRAVSGAPSAPARSSPPRRPLPTSGRVLVGGAIAMLVLAGLALALRGLAGPIDGGPVLFGAPTGFVGRAALAVAAAGLLALVAGLAGRRRRSGRRSGDRANLLLPGAGPSAFAEESAPLRSATAPAGASPAHAPANGMAGHAPDVAVSVAGSAAGADAVTAPGSTPPIDRLDGWAWGAVLALLAGAALCDFAWAALPLFAAGGAAAARWLAGRGGIGRPVEVAVLALIAALAAAGVGETVARALLREDLARRVVARTAPPSAAELTAIGEELTAAFAGAGLEDFLPRSPEGLERQDLAFLLWHASPLAHPHALSGLALHAPEGTSTFGFGLALTEDGAVDWSALRWQDLAVGAPEEAVVAGQGPLLYRGEPWATLEWTLVPLPGHRLAPRAEVEQIEVALLRGGPAGRPLPGLSPSIDGALYDGEGRALSSPWEESPPLPEALAAGALRAQVRTPEGPAWAAARRSGKGWWVLFLPVLSPLAGLERVGSHALGLLLVALAAAAVALLVALPRAAFREVLGRTVRSYSKRLLLVYTLLLLVPLLLLNTVLVAGMGDRLRREQRATGDGALSAAQRVLGDYLASVEPGFDLASELDNSLLGWLSGVVRHEVNLYWGSEIWSSTKPELFAARLLPPRIPGESYARLALLGYDRASRTNRVGDVSYLELYAPLALPGEEVGLRNFFLSMPLLAQQEEVARELDALRRQALLVTAALVVLVTAVGVRLSKSFTRPITELVAGTRRIAAGAPSLDLAPTELELAALVEAVDDMARRIAEGRERLVREKQVVERIVEHITSGVVSLDRHRRVLMRNRVAAELLGVEVGDRLPEVVAARPRLAPVAEWLPEVGGELAQRTVRLAAAGDGAEGGGEDATGGGEGAEPGEEREWTLVWVPVPGAGEPAALLVVEDATETLRGQRLEAWAEMARIIAHEIKNPLTPIRLNVEHMQQVWRDLARRGEAGEAGGGRFAEVFARCTGNVLTQVDELQQIAAEFSTYSRIPRIDLQPGDLVELAEELAAPYRTAPPAGVTVELETPPGPLSARFDRRLLARAVRNLIENALRASSGGGRVVLRVERREAAGDGHAGGAEARVAVLDSGAGVEPALLPRIFDPYFSTHDTGTGLGLPIARQIAEEHGGGIAARNRAEGGLEVAITLPLG